MPLLSRLSGRDDTQNIVGTLPKKICPLILEVWGANFRIITYFQ